LTLSLQLSCEQGLEILDSDEETDTYQGLESGNDSDEEMGGDVASSMPSKTDWQDANVESRIVCENTRLTRQFVVDQIEYLSEIPWVWPVPTVAIAHVLDLRDPKFRVVENKLASATPSHMLASASEQPMDTSPSLFAPFMVLDSGFEPNLAQQSLNLPNGILRSIGMDLGLMDILDDFLPRHPGPPDEFA